MTRPIIVMGVSGSGKSTIGQLLASRLQMKFLDADDFHPTPNKEKMAAGKPLDDQDRLPWLQVLSQRLAQNQSVVLACSALKDGYRQILDPLSQYHWVYLNGTRELIFERMQQRAGHFMKADMLDSQYQTLEIPEDAIEVNVDQIPEKMVDQIVDQINS